MIRTVLLCALTAAVVAQGAILPFLKTPKHDGIKRVCTLTADNFTTVVTAADTAVVVVQNQAEKKSACPTELDTFAEVRCLLTLCCFSVLGKIRRRWSCARQIPNVLGR